jgi:hypothetical protein
VGVLELKEAAEGFGVFCGEGDAALWFLSVCVD